MIQEKQMVNDALSNINAGLTSYASMIVQTQNQELRNTLKQMRDQAEKSQYDLYTIAKNLNYYTPAQQASQDEIMKVKSEVTCGCSDCECSDCGCSSSTSSDMQTSGSSSSMSASNFNSGMSASSSSSGMSASNSSGQNSGLLKDIDKNKLKDLQAPPKPQTRG